MRQPAFCRPEKCKVRCIEEVKYKIYEMKCCIIVKECPRCGCECHHMAPGCHECGYPMPKMHEHEMPMGHMGHMGRMGMMHQSEFDDDDD